MVSIRKEDLDGGDDYENVRGRTYEPLLNPQSSQTSGSAKGDTRGKHSDIWGSRIREKVFIFLFHPKPLNFDIF